MLDGMKTDQDSKSLGKELSKPNDGWVWFVLFGDSRYHWAQLSRTSTEGVHCNKETNIKEKASEGKIQFVNEV